MYEGSIFQQSEAAEGAITEEEHKKTHALEAIIAYDTIAKARQNVKEIEQQIKVLNAKMPLNQAPESSTQFKEMLDRMAELDINKNPTTNFGLKYQIDYLVKHYKSLRENYDIPV